MRATRLIPILAIALGAAAPAAAQQTPPAPGTPHPFEVPEARELTLPNGLAVTLVPYGDVPKATVQLIVRVGNVDEGPQQVWLADVTADLMQEGTTSRSGEQIAEDAARMGGALSVAVGANQTTVGGSALTEFVPEMVRLVADVAMHPAFPTEPLERIRGDRLRQLSIERSQPQSLAVEKFRSVLYPSHPYGRIYPTAEMLQSYTVEQARAFHDANFEAARAHLYIAGRFDAAGVESAIRSAFGGWESGTPASQPVPTPTSQRAIYLVDKPGAVQSTIYMGLPVVDPSSPDYVALQVTNALLGGSFASRITSNIREQKGYTYSPVSTISARYRDAYWAEVADVTTNVTGPSLKEIFYEIDRLRAEPPSAEELRGIQNYLAGTFVLQNSSRGGIIGQLAFLDLHGLDRDWLATYVQRVYAVTPADVQRIARTYIDPSRMTIVVVGDRSQIAEQLAAYGEVRTE
jgi:predicted Zn-dependent peptidase